MNTVIIAEDGYLKPPSILDHIGITLLLWEDDILYLFSVLVISEAIFELF